MTIGERIKALRKKNDLTQEKLADYLCVSYQAVSKWECGLSSPDLSLIVPLAKLLRVTTDELLGMVVPETDERKLEYDALCAKAHHPEQLEIAQQAKILEIKEILSKGAAERMSVENKYLTDEELERLIYEVETCDLVPAPPDLEENIIQKIRHRKTENFEQRRKYMFYCFR